MASSKSLQNRERFWTPVRLALTCTVLALLAAFGASSCSSTPPTESGKANANAPKANSPTVTISSGRPAAAPPPTAPSLVSPVSLPAGLSEMPLSLLDGKTIKLSDFAGKVVVLNFWATWCGPCRAEMPELIRLYSDYKNRGVEVIGVASKQNDASLDEVKKFVRQMNVNYKIVYEDGSFAPPLLQAIHARGVIPQSVILSRTGQVIEHKQGYNPAMTPAQLRDVIEQALKG